MNNIDLRPPTGRAGDHCGPRRPQPKTPQQFLPDADLLRRRIRQRNANRVANAFLQQHSQSRAAGDDSFGPHAGFRQAEVERVVASGGQQPVDVHEVADPRDLRAHDDPIVRQTGLLGQLGRTEGRFEHRLDHHVPRRAGRSQAGVRLHERGQQRRVQRPPVHPDPDRPIVLEGDAHDRLEVLIAPLGAHVAGVDPVLRERAGRLRVLHEEKVAVVVEVAHDRRVEAESAHLPNDLGDRAGRRLVPAEVRQRDRADDDAVRRVPCMIMAWNRSLVTWSILLLASHVATDVVFAAEPRASSGLRVEYRGAVSLPEMVADAAGSGVPLTGLSGITWFGDDRYIAVMDELAKVARREMARAAAVASPPKALSTMLSTESMTASLTHWTRSSVNPHRRPRIATNCARPSRHSAEALRRSSTGTPMRCCRSTWRSSKAPRRTAASCSRRSRNVSPRSGTSSCEESAVRLTDPRISHLSHRLRNALQQGGGADFPDEPAAHREAKAILDTYADAEEAVDAFARERISRLSRQVPEGGREWEILYRKYFEEEITRRKL